MLKASNSHSHRCHVQVTLGASHLVRIIQPTALKVLNPNVRKQTLGISRTHGAGLVLLLHKASTRAREQTFLWTPRSSSYSDHLNPSTDTFVLRSTRVCSQLVQLGMGSPKDTRHPWHSSRERLEQLRPPKWGE